MKIVVLLAGGSGARIQNHVNDKSTTLLLNKSVFIYGLEAFIKTHAFEKFIIVFRDEAQKAYMQSALSKLAIGSIDLDFVKGGFSRYESVRNALSFIQSISSKNDDIIAIHDVARPLIKPKLILDLLDIAIEKGSAIPVSKITNTIMSVNSDENITENYGGFLNEILDRDKLRAVETPQLFKLELLSRCYFKSTEIEHKLFTDDASVCMQHGYTPIFIENESPNPKITTKNDLEYILYLLNQKSL